MKTFIFCMTLIAAIGIAHANDDGKAGRTSRIGDGCGDCHGLSVSTNTMVTLIGVGGAPTVTPGSTTTFTIRVAHATMPTAGIGIAVVDAMDTGMEVGTLIPGAGLKVKGADGELVHSAPMAMNGGMADFTFEWTAPETPGTYYLQAVGNAVNGDGEEDDADAWAWMSPVEITVSSTSGVDEDVVADHLTVAPNPCPRGTMFTLSGVPSQATNITVRSITGQLVHHVSTTGAGGPIPVQTPDLPPGVFGVVVETPTGITRTTVLIAP